MCIRDSSRRHGVNVSPMEVPMKRLFVVAVLACTALAVFAPHAHAFGIMGSWWNIKDTDSDGWGGGIRQEIPLIPGKHDAEEGLVHLSLDTRASFLLSLYTSP